MARIDARNSAGNPTVTLDGDTGNIHAGGHGQAGNLFLNDAQGRDTIHLDGATANIHTGGRGQAGDLFVNNAQGQPTIRLDGANGDINLVGADCAEDFDIDTKAIVEPGTVMVVGEEGILYPSQSAYDKRVAGVVSGGGGYKPGIVLDTQRTENHRQAIALLGKVYCRVDSQYSSIEVGDLLTSSPTAGHAMKAADPFKALGAVLGKALRPLEEGQGLIPILVALQ
jgi:hypothetical protein